MGQFNKATVTFIGTSFFGILAALFPQYQQPIAGIGTVITTAATYLVPNAPS